MTADIYSAIFARKGLIYQGHLGALLSQSPNWPPN